MTETATEQPRPVIRMGDDEDARLQLALINAAGEYFNVAQRWLTEPARAAVAEHLAAGGALEVAVSVPAARLELRIVTADGAREVIITGYCKVDPGGPAN